MLRVFNTEHVFAVVATIAMVSVATPGQAASCEKETGWKASDYIEFRVENKRAVDLDVEIAATDADGKVVKKVQDGVPAGQSELIGARQKLVPGTWTYRVSFGIAGSSRGPADEISFGIEVKDNDSGKRQGRLLGRTSGADHGCSRSYNKSNKTWKIKLSI